MHDIALVLALLAVVAALVSVANRLSLPYPILLVIGGLILGFIPNRVLPDVVLEPDLVLLLFLPPLLYWDAVNTSWRDFRAPMASSPRISRADLQAARLLTSVKGERSPQ